MSAESRGRECGVAGPRVRSREVRSVVEAGMMWVADAGDCVCIKVKKRVVCSAKIHEYCKKARQIDNGMK